MPHLNNNKLVAPIPAELGQLQAQSTTRLNLSWNQLSGPIPVELLQLGVLMALYLQNNQISGLYALRLHLLEHNPRCHVGY